MELVIKITKGLVTKSVMCGTPNNDELVTESCLLAHALKEIFPAVRVSDMVSVSSGTEYIGSFLCNKDMMELIDDFDNMVYDPMARYSLVGREVKMDIPDSIVDKLYTSHVELAQRIIDSEVLQTV